MNNFYIYICLDPRKSGIYKYEKYKFDYEPFYVGKGSSGWIPSEDIRKKISKSHIGKHQGINNHMYGLSGEKSPRFGRYHSDETKKKISEKTTGRNNPMFGLYGKNSPMYGKHHTEEWKKKQSERRKGKDTRSIYWEVICQNGEIIMFKNLTKFCLENKINSDSIRHCSIKNYNNEWRKYKNYYFRKVLKDE